LIQEYLWAIVAVISVLGTVLIVSLRVKFDLNEWLQHRRKRHLLKLQNACTHAKLGVAGDGSVAVSSWFTSPVGVGHWICERCGMRIHNEAHITEQMDFWARHPAEHVDQEKAYRKALKKHGGI